jgi:hypothetical protein
MRRSRKLGSVAQYYELGGLLGVLFGDVMGAAGKRDGKPELQDAVSGYLGQITVFEACCGFVRVTNGVEGRVKGPVLSTCAFRISVL